MHNIKGTIIMQHYVGSPGIMLELGVGYITIDENNNII